MYIGLPVCVFHWRIYMFPNFLAHAPPPPAGPNSFIFTEFSVCIGGPCPLNWSTTSLREILDPPLYLPAKWEFRQTQMANPGRGTDHVTCGPNFLIFMQLWKKIRGLPPPSVLGDASLSLIS